MYVQAAGLVDFFIGVVGLPKAFGLVARGMRAIRLDGCAAKSGKARKVLLWDVEM